MNVLISGSHGLIGSQLVHVLSGAGHEITRLGRNLSAPIGFEHIDAVVHLAGENIANGRWTSAKKEAIKNSRIEGTHALSSQIATAQHKPKVFISGSAIGYYGDRTDEILTEKSLPGSGFLPEVCIGWEEQTKSAMESGVRTVHLRTGIVLSSEGGALKKMLTPFKLGGGGKLGSGKQYMSWISISDMVRAIIHIIEHPEISGPVNMVSPNPLPNAEFTKVLGKVLKRPTVLPLPSFAARLLFGEMADALLLSSSRVMPNVLLETKFEFKHMNLESALRSVINDSK